MKIALLFIASFFFCPVCSAQNFGIRSSSNFCGDDRLNLSMGAGLYVNFSDTAKIDVLISSDFYHKESIFPEEGFESDLIRFQFSVGCIHSIPVYKALKLRMGPALGFQIINGMNAGLVANWLGPFVSYNMSLGLIFNLRVAEILKSGFNIETFVTPQYLFGLKTSGNSPSDKNSTNLKLMDLQVGISYHLK